MKTLIEAAIEQLNTNTYIMENNETEHKPKYLGVAVSKKGRIFSHPANPLDDTAHLAAKARGDYPYTHLYDGDDVHDAIDKMHKET